MKTISPLGLGALQAISDGKQLVASTSHPMRYGYVTDGKLNLLGGPSAQTIAFLRKQNWIEYAASDRYRHECKITPAGAAILKNPPAKRVSVGKQEAVVGVLWQFAKDQDKLERDITGTPYAGWDGERFTTGTETQTISSKAIGKAIEEIMALFGYDVASIQ